jgi:cysteine desulfurase
MSRPIYFDYQATTPLDPRVLDAMLPYLKDRFGNAASKSHRFGFEAAAAVKHAREQVAAAFGCDPLEVVFTSGSTEGINLALKGVAALGGDRGDHFVTAPTEHPAVLDTLGFLETKGFRVTRLNVDARGGIDLADLRAAITPRTLAVALMAANNEIGTRHPLAEIGALCAEKRTLFFCDATQGVGKFDFDVRRDGIHLASFSGHKLYAPKGVGALYVRRSEPRVDLEPLFHGGGHEHGFRSGTLAVPSIVALGKACELAGADLAAESARLERQRERLKAILVAGLDDVIHNGHPTFRLPGNLSVAFRYVEGEALMSDLGDIALSSGSACHSANAQPSHVLAAIGLEPAIAHSTLRFGLGRFTTDEEVEIVGQRVVESVKRLRELSPLYELAKRKK